VEQDLPQLDARVDPEDTRVAIQRLGDGERLEGVGAGFPARPLDVWRQLRVVEPAPRPTISPSLYTPHPGPNVCTCMYIAS
jgi:hypothetical protein